MKLKQHWARELDVYSADVAGADAAAGVAMSLLRTGRYFSVLPLGEDKFEVVVRSENRAMLDSLIEQPGTGVGR